MKAIKYFACIILLTLQPISAQNFWQQTNGPYGGATVNDFLLYNDSTIFLATDEGIIISYDNAENWSRIFVGMKISCLEKDYIGTLYAGAKDDGDNGFLLKSTNAGNNWDAKYMGADIKTILIPYIDTIIVGSWDRGLYRSFDHGTNWTLINNGIQYTGIYEIILLSDGSLLIGTSGGGVYKSTNWGDSWTSSNNGIPGSGYIYAESFCELSLGQVFTGTYSGIYYSTNYGDSWVFKSAGCTNKVARCIVNDEYGILYAGTRISSGVYYSTNGGDYWYHLGLGHSIYTIGWDSDSRLYAGGSGDGLYRLNITDTSWTQVYNQGYTPVNTTQLTLTLNGNLLASTIWWGLHYTTNGGQLWTKTNYRGYEPNAIETINDSIFIAGGSSYVSVSNDTCKTWNTTGNFHTRSLYYEPSRQLLYLGTENSTNYKCAIYKSSNFGQNWELLYEFPVLTPYQRIGALHVSKTNQVLLASVSYWVPPPINTGYYYFHQSTDYGQTWEIIYQSQYRSVSRIIEDPTSTLFALAGTKLLTHLTQNYINNYYFRISYQSKF